MIVYKVKNDDVMKKMAADIFCAQVNQNPASVLGFATGSTPIPLYEELIKRYTQGIVDFSKATSFNLDEYCGLDKTHDQSYYYFMMKNLFENINLPKENIHLPNGIADDVKKECEDYEAQIAQSGGIDLQLLGIGLNGHIGFNEPNTVFTDKTHQETLTEKTKESNKRFFKDISEVPQQAISMGSGSIMRAKKVLLLGSKGKQSIIEKMLNSEIDPQCPASILKVHPNCVVIYIED